jgi:hypothetical protein
VALGKDRMVLTWLEEGDEGGSRPTRTPLTTPEPVQRPFTNLLPHNPLLNHGEYFARIRRQLSHWRMISSSAYLTFLSDGVIPFFKEQPRCFKYFSPAVD